MIFPVVISEARVVGATSVLLADPSFGLNHGLARVLVLAALTAVCELIVLARESEAITLTEIAVIANVVLLPPALALVAALMGLTFALALRRTTLTQTLLKLGRFALGLVVCLTVYHGISGGRFSSTSGLLALAGGAFAFTGVNLMCNAALLAARQHRRYGEALQKEGSLAVAIGLGCSCLGIIGVTAYLSRPLLLPFVLGPALAVHLAFRGWVRQRSLSIEIGDEKTKLERIVAHSSEGIVLASGDGSIELWSPSMERITGIPSAAAVGKQVAFLLRGRGPMGETASVRVNASAEPFELEFVTPNGEVQWLRGIHGPGLAPDGTLAFDVIVVTDVTRHREVERLKSDFISTVSHELRTPLTPIKGFASLLLRRSEDLSPERKREALATIIERSDHLSRLVEDLLLAASMSRESERRLPDIARSSIDAGVLVERALAFHRRANPHRSFMVEQERPLTVLADPLRAEQMISHVISNAIKFSDEMTPVKVSISAENGAARIDVTDQGRGIPADKQTEIFERFKRLENPLRMETGGAGLGLFIVRQLASAMDVSVTLRSEVGKGSTFTLCFPLLAPLVSVQRTSLVG